MSGESAEFRITNDLAPIRNFQIQANFDECREWLNTELEPYRTMAVTTDSIPQAKKYRANIRRVRDHIDECRKLAKKEVLAVYEPFEAQCKELTMLCDEAAQAIDTQVKAYEEEVRAEKEKALHSYFDTQIAEISGLSEYLNWMSTFNSRWLNTTFGIDKAEAEIDAAITKCRDEVCALRALNTEFETALLHEYSQTHNFAACLRRNAELVETKRREEQRKAGQEAARRAEAERRAAQEAERAARAAEAEKRAAEAKTTTQPLPVVEEARPTIEERVEENLITMDFRVYLTREQLSELKAFLVGNGIRYSRVPQ